MTHSELLVSLVDKMPKMNTFDMDILKDIVAGVALKEESIYEFYREVTTSGAFVDMALIERISSKYSVPSMYRKHIDSRFDLFKSNIKRVCVENKQLVEEGKNPGFNPIHWEKNNKPIFGSTERITIEKAGGLEDICQEVFNVGYFDYLKKLFESAATEVSKMKYSLIIKSQPKAIEGGIHGK